MTDILRLIIRNCLRHRWRSALTITGIAVALFAFCFIRTLIAAWYSGVDLTAKNRLIVRNAVSLIFYLPFSYGTAIAQISGVKKVAYGCWFGGVYKDEEYSSFQQLAVSSNYMDLYPELLFEQSQREAYESDRKAAFIGQHVADEYGFKIGDVFQLRGTIFPGMWEFTVRGIFRANQPEYDTRMMFFHWEYWNERNKTEINIMPDHVGWYVVQIPSDADPAVISRNIDARFANSYAETITETETAFVQGFISMLQTIITAMNVISVVVLVIMLLVLTNTMLMSARERYREYAVLKSLGFARLHLYGLLLGEAAVLSLAGFVLLGAVLGVVFSLPPTQILGELAKLFPNFTLKPLTVALAFAATLAVALVAGTVPAVHIARLRVTEALRLLA